MKNPIARILWYALLFSQVVYLYVPTRLAGGSTASPESVDRISLVLAAVAIGVGVATLIVRRRMLVAPIQTGQLDPDTPEGFQKAFVPFILNLALTESIAIHGLVIALLSREPVRAWPFAVAAFALMFWHRPTAPDLSPPAGSGTWRPPAL